jgi:hypothetical protein
VVLCPLCPPSEDKGKVVRVIHIDDEVSSDDDVPLQRRMRVADSGGSAVDKPQLAATVPRPDSSTMMRATMPGGPTVARLQATRWC